MAGAGAILAIVASFILLTAAPASAHHPVLIQAGATCGPEGYTVSFVSETWAFTPEQEFPFINGGLHSNLDVRIGVDGATPVDLLAAGGSITFGQSAVAGNGAYTDGTSPVRTFGGSVFVPNGATSVTAVVQAIGPWGSGSGGGETASATIQLSTVECPEPAVPSIDIEKATNGVDADQPSGPVLEVGSDVTWAYVVRNTGEVDLQNVAVTDDQGVVPVRDDSTDVGSDNILSIGESWTYTAAGTAVEGQYANVGSVTADPVVQGPPVSDTDPSHYIGFIPYTATVDIEKSTNDHDADDDPVELLIDQSVVWRYVVTNTSDELYLANLVITDDPEGYVCTIEGPLAPGESDNSCTLHGTAVEGLYENVGHVVAQAVTSAGEPALNPDGSPVTPDPTDTDPSQYEATEVGGIVETPTPAPTTAPAPVPTAVTPLAVTGSTSSVLAIIGGGLVLLGGMMLAVRRRFVADVE